MRPIQKLEDLAEELVPDHFILNSPQFYELVKAFLRNLQQVQESIDVKFLDTIDYDRIKNSDYKKIYLQTYLAMFGLENVDNYESLGDMVKISKDLSQLKGTSLIFAILVKLLVFIIPSVGGQYNDLLQEYIDETDPILKAELQKQLYELKLRNLDGGAVLYSEYFDDDDNLIPFRYLIMADITRAVYEQYIKPFAHPAGWHDTFVPVWIAFFTDTLEIVTGYSSFTLFDMFVYPQIVANALTTLENEDNAFPNNYYQRAELGLETAYDYFASRMLVTSNLVKQNGKVYYVWDNMNNPPTYTGTYGEKKKTRATLSTPTEPNMILRAGLYSGDTTKIGTANGSLTAGSFHLGYMIQMDDNRDWDTVVVHQGCD